MLKFALTMLFSPETSLKNTCFLQVQVREEKEENGKKRIFCVMILSYDLFWARERSKQEVKTRSKPSHTPCRALPTHRHLPTPYTWRAHTLLHSSQPVQRHLRGTLRAKGAWLSPHLSVPWCKPPKRGARELGGRVRRPPLSACSSWSCVTSPEERVSYDQFGPVRLVQSISSPVQSGRKSNHISNIPSSSI
mgnify:CR=1 FL=1